MITYTDAEGNTYTIERMEKKEEIVPQKVGPLPKHKIRKDYKAFHNAMDNANPTDTYMATDLIMEKGKVTDVKATRVKRASLVGMIPLSKLEASIKKAKNLGPKN